MRLLTLYFILLLCIQCKKEAKLYFPSNEIILGNVKLNSYKKISIPIQNKGKLPLVIKNVSSSCKCLITNFPSKGILKGETEYINLVYNANEAGYHTESIAIITNESDIFRIIHINVNVLQ